MVSSRNAWLRKAVFAFMVTSVGCYSGLSEHGALAEEGGEDGSTEEGDDAEDDVGEQCADEAASGVAIRRLTRTEYSHTVADLFALDFDPGEELPVDAIIDGFDNSSAGANVSQALADTLFEAAERVAEAATEDLESLLPCSPEEVTSACIRDLAETLGRRAFRRPLDADEVDRLVGLYEGGSTEDTLNERVALVIEAILMSPQFLFRVEEIPQDVDPEAGSTVPLTGWEIATRLSFFAWASGPDDALLDAAEAGLLDTPEGIAAELERLLDDPRARRTTDRFAEQWLELHRASDKDPGLYPEYDQALAASMREQTSRFVAEVILERSGTLAELLTSNETRVDERLAALYGIPAPDEAWAPVVLPEQQRRGLLTHASFLSSHAHAIDPAPIQRGVFVRTVLLCMNLPPPPPDVDVDVPLPDPDKTNRERVSAHVTDPACAGCHTLIDPLGFAFEHYDAIGAYRTVEGNALPIDATGELTGTDVDREFDDALGMIDALAQSELVHQCMAGHVFRYALGRPHTHAEACVMENLYERFLGSGGDMRDLMVALGQSDSFRHRPIGEGGE